MNLKELANPQYLVIFLAGFLFVYLFLCLCFSQICAKTGKPGGVLVWLPMFQLIPLLRAAGMSGWWLLAHFVPVLNLIAQIIWSFKIAEARGKNTFVGFLLLLPIFNLFALIYLAFSGAGPKEKKAAPSGKISLMTLETA